MNPGSWGHLTGQCRPCNKYIFGKSKSCKYDNNCMFCHGSDHKNKRINRQYIDVEEPYPIWCNELIDSIYDKIQEINENIKKFILSIDNIVTQNQIIKQIGIELIKNCQTINEHQCDNLEIKTIYELEKQFKWLQGATHIIIKKIYKNNLNYMRMNNINEFVIKVIKIIEELSLFIQDSYNII